MYQAEMLCLGLTQLRTSTCFSPVHLEAVIVSLFIWALSARAFRATNPEYFHQGGREVSGLAAARLFFICGSHKHPGSFDHKRRERM